MLAVSLLESIPEFSSDDAEFILDVVNQYLTLIEGTNDDKKKIVRRYATVIVDDLRKQIYASKEENTEFVFRIQKDLIVFRAFVKNMKNDGRLNYKKEVTDKKNIKQYLFEGYRKMSAPHKSAREGTSGKIPGGHCAPCSAPRCLGKRSNRYLPGLLGLAG